MQPPVGVASVGDWLPDQFGDIEDEVGFGLFGFGRSAHFPNAHTDGVVESTVLLCVAQMKDRADDLLPPGWVGRPYPWHSNMIVASSSVSITARKSGRNGPTAPWRGEVRAAETTTDLALASSLGEEQMLFPAALEADHPALGIPPSPGRSPHTADGPPTWAGVRECHLRQLVGAIILMQRIERKRRRRRVRGC